MGAVRLGRYTVLKHLASGGMADLLLGRADGIDGFARHVVLKRIKAEHARDQRFIQMFLDEARIAASLHHANIVQVHDIGETQGEYFFAMEYLHGEDVRKLLSSVSRNKTHIPLGIVCAIVSAAAAGLHYAHERRGADRRPLEIVHRDISPSNIIIGYDGSVKLLDFGIAKAAVRGEETRTGSLKGKISYMSPEQCKGEPVDRRSDVYALGVLLYELSTTTRLFKGDNDYLVMDAIVNGKVPLPRVRRPDLPNELSSIIMNALAVDPERRFQTADELRTALDQFAAKQGLATSHSAVAGYLHKQFGERPEPWLELELDPELAPPPATWSPPVPAADATVSARGHRGRVRETRTSMKMGWEAQTPEPPAAPIPDLRAGSRRGWLALGALTAVAAAGVAVWQLVLVPREHAPVIAAVAPPAPAAPRPTVTPLSAPAPVAAPAGSAIVAPAVAPAAAPGPLAAAAAEPASPEPAPRERVTRERTRSRPAHHAHLREAPEAVAPVTEPLRAPVAEAPPPAVTTPLPPVGAVAATPLPPPPPPVPTIATLSHATVQMVAGDHSRQLAACDSFADGIHGEVSVSFQIDGRGKVVKSQLAAAAKKPRLAACLLKAVQSWQFPRPPTGAAKGVYSIDYQ